MPSQTTLRHKRTYCLLSYCKQCGKLIIKKKASGIKEYENRVCCDNACNSEWQKNLNNPQNIYNKKRKPRPKHVSPSIIPPLKGWGFHPHTDKKRKA